FPGSQPTPSEKKLSPTSFPSPQTGDELPAASLEKGMTDGHSEGEATPTSDGSSPQMAPPLRRRTKKRGFFKRLFGIR
ncbi:MAG: hypothetical protein D6800_11110, partial [Candidatus Zixiibacteriota bacterium]